MVTKIYLDTEFTGLQHPTSLISLGLVSENDAALYIEFNNFERSQVDIWIYENVLNNLFVLNDYHFADEDVQYGYAGGYINSPLTWNKRAIAYAGDSSPQAVILNWLKSHKDSIQIVSDCASYDWVLFCQIFGGALKLPDFISPYCHDINQDLANYLASRFDGLPEHRDRFAFNYSREEFAFPNQILLDDAVKQFKYLTGAHNSKHNALWDAMIIKRCDEIINNQ